MTATVICLLATQTSGAAGAPQSPSADSRALSLAAYSVTAPVHISGANRSARPRDCSAWKAVRFYSRRIEFWRDKMGASAASPRGQGKTPGVPGPKTVLPCPRYLAHVLQRKAYALRKTFAQWWVYHYDWRAWLPDKHQRVGACETGYGKRPGNFAWDSGRYVSFAGIYREGYDDDAHRVGNLGWDETKRKLGRLPTPREQMQAVDSHRVAHGGWSGWGCRNA